MNTSEDRIEILQQKQGELAQIVEALKEVESSVQWQKIKRLLLDDIVTNLERQVFDEASKEQIDMSKLYRLQGQLMWARKYTDLHKLAESFKQQIDGIKYQLKHE